MNDVAGLCAALGAGAVWLAQAPRPDPALLLRGPDAVTPGPIPAAGQDGRPLSAATLRLTVAAAVVATAVTVAGPSGWLLAAGVGIAVHRWLSGRSSRADNDRAAALRRDLPLALDLMAAALVSGATTPAALALAAQGTGAPVATALHEVATSIQLGADPEEAWRSALREPALAPLGRLATRSTASGSAMAQACRQLAARSREALVVEARVAVKRAGVLSVLPLALCFLPAFVLVGIVPVVAGLLRSLVL